MVPQRVDCLYVLTDKSWWVATAEEIDYVPSKVTVHYRFQNMDSLNPDMVTIVKLYSEPILVFSTVGSTFKSCKIGFIYSDTEVDISDLADEDQLLFK